MKKLYSIFTTILLTVSCAFGKDVPTSHLQKGAVTDAAVQQSSMSIAIPKTLHEGGTVTDATIEHSTTTLIVSMIIHPEAFKKRANREMWLTPLIINGDSVKSLKPVVLAGRTRYYQRLREDGKNAPYILLHSGETTPYEYSVNVAREPWMNKGKMMIVSQLDGCCGAELAAPEESQLAMFDFRDKTLDVKYVYVKPVGEMIKSRAVSDKAYIDFPVNSTQILPDYRRNPSELAKIGKTLEEMRNSKDVTIKSMTIKGFASPEGSYANNERLAKGRTEALIKYVAERFSVPLNVLHSEWVAEDWAGLAEQIEASEIWNKNGLLAIVNDTAMTPDERDAALNNRYPTQYAWLLENVYPSLRRTDYRVDYVVRNYSDVNEIAQVIRTTPQHLSLEEIFIYAKSLDEDSPEFREVMEVAVRMFPSDPTANLNAATTAIDHGEYAKAAEYLKKADPTSPVTKYAAGLLLAKQENYLEALSLLEAAANGVDEAAAIVAQIKEWGLDNE